MPAAWQPAHADAREVEGMKLARAIQERNSIAKHKSDPEVAHRQERRLHQAVLKAVAAGHPDSAELAKIALSTSEIEFSRWYG